jgi:hypothetical protein
MADDAGPQSGDVFLQFNGTDAYAEIPSLVDYSVSTTGGLTVSAWMRPDTLNFSNLEPNSTYIHWLGKGDAKGGQEWTFRMYNQDDPLDHPPRPNRISYYVFNLSGGTGVGSYVQSPVVIGQWIHLVAVIDAARVYLYENGAFARCDTYRGPEACGCEIHFEPPPNDTAQLVINPQPGLAPLRLGSKDLKGFLQGGLTRVRLWNRPLTCGEVSDLLTADAAPLNGLKAEFLLNADTGATVVDTAQANNGTIFNAVWATQS